MENSEKAPVKALIIRHLVKHAHYFSFSLCFFFLFMLSNTMFLLFLYLGYGLLFIIAFGYLVVLGDKKQTLHDLIAGTSVFKS
jgi:uncharacterized RDD family membrane protein YckC